MCANALPTTFCCQPLRAMYATCVQLGQLQLEVAHPRILSIHPGKGWIDELETWSDSGKRSLIHNSLDSSGQSNHSSTNLANLCLALDTSLVWAASFPCFAGDL